LILFQIILLPPTPYPTTTDSGGGSGGSSSNSSAKQLENYVCSVFELEVDVVEKMKTAVAERYCGGSSDCFYTTTTTSSTGTATATATTKSVQKAIEEIRKKFSWEEKIRSYQILLEHFSKYDALVKLEAARGDSGGSSSSSGGGGGGGSSSSGGGGGSRDAKRRGGGGRNNSRSRHTPQLRFTTFSSNTKWLLHCYADIVGVDEVCSRVLLLGVMTSFLQHSTDVLPMIQSCLKSITKKITSSGGSGSIDKNTIDVLHRNLGILNQYLQSRLTQFKLVFPHNRPKGGLASLLKVVEETLRLQKVLNGSNNDIGEEMVVYVRGCLERIGDIDYEAVRMEADIIVADTEKKELLENDEANRIVLMCDLLDERLCDVLDFKSEFSKLVDIEVLYTTAFDRRLRESVVDFVESLKPGELGVDVFAVAAKIHTYLNMIRQQLSSGEQQLLPPLLLHQQFQPAVLDWIGTTIETLKHWSSRAVEIEEWQPDANNASASVVDVFDACAQLINILDKHSFLDPHSHGESNESYIEIFGKVIISRIVQIYCDLLFEREVVDTIHTTTAAATTVVDSFRNSDLVILTKALPRGCTSTNIVTDASEAAERWLFSTDSCVRANNLDAARSMLLDLEEQLSVSDIFSDTLTYIRGAIHKMIDVLLLKIARFTQPLLQLLLQKNKESEKQNYLDELFSFLNEQMAVLGEVLYESMFSRFLQRLWHHLTQVLLLVLLPPSISIYGGSSSGGGVGISISGGSGGSSEFADDYSVGVVKQLLPLLQDFLHADGVGLKRSYFEKSSNGKLLSKVLQLTEKKSSKLVDTATSATPHAEVAVRILSARAARDKTDEAARAFVKSRKRAEQ